MEREHLRREGKYGRGDGQRERTDRAAAAESSPGAGVELATRNDGSGKRGGDGILRAALPELCARLRIVRVDHSAVTLADKDNAVGDRRSGVGSIVAAERVAPRDLKRATYGNLESDDTSR